MRAARRVGMVILASLALVFAVREGVRYGLPGHLKVHPQGARTPGTLGLKYEAFTFESRGRALQAFFVPADGPALLIFHGNGESISGWVPALRLLHDGGVAAMVFDYGGFGNSQGKPGFAQLHADGLAAWQAFRARLSPGQRACAYGLSLGTGVLLDVAAELSPAPDCVALSGAFLSLRDAAGRLGGYPDLAVRVFMPDVFDNLEHIAQVQSPLLIEHGSEDELFPPAWAQRLKDANARAEVVIIPGMHHGDPVVHPSAQAWDPVLRLVRSEPLAAQGGRGPK